MVTQVTSTVMGSNAISANNIADNSIVSRHIGDNVILARHVEDGVDPGIVQANLNATTANINTVTANVNSVKGNVDAAEANIASILAGTNFTGTITTNESTSLGVSNLTPETTSITIGSPANVIIQYGTSANPVGGNVIIGEGNGDIDGSITPFRLDVRGSANVGALSATSLSGTLSTAAQGNITSLGTLTSLTVDNIIVNGTNIGHTSDTDAIAIASDGKTTFSQQTTHSGGIVIPNDGDIGSVGATDAVQISSGGIVTFKDDIILKDAATIGVTSSTSAISIASTGIVTFVDDIKIKDAGTIGSVSSPTAIEIASDGIVTFADDIKIKDAGTIGSASSPTAIGIASDGIVTFADDIKIKDAGTIGSVSSPTAIGIASDGIVTFADDIKIKDAGTIGSATTPAAISIASDGIVTFVDDIKIKDSGTIGSASAPGAITVAGDGAVTVSDDLTITGNLIVSGDTVDQNVTNLTVEDRIILTASGASGTPSLDTGLMMSRGAQGNVFVGYDESVNKVVVAHTSSPHTNTAISATSAANLDARHITAESIVLSGDAGVLVPNDGNIGSAGSTAAIQIASDGVVTFVDDIKIKDGGTIGVASAADAMTVSSAGIVTFKDDILIKDGGTIGVASSTGAITIASTGIVTFADDIKIKDAGTIGSASSPTAIGIASDGIVTFADDIKIKDGGTIGVASKAEVITIAADGDTAIAGGLGIAGNTAPVAAAISLGTPANAVIRTHAASGKANIIVGDATATSSYNLDVRGTANVGAFLTQGVDPLANDLATFNRLNANINVVQDNVAAVAGTTLSPATNVVTSVAGANAYGIGAAVSVIGRTRVSLSGIGQLPTTDYVVPGSGVIQLTDPSATIPAGIPIHINYWN